MFNRIFAVDPGTYKSAYVLYNGKTKKVEECGILENEALLNRAEEENQFDGVVVCEWIESMGMPVGAEVFETVYFIGRLRERCRRPFYRVARREVKLTICGSPRAKDANIRQALIDLIGAPGTKKNPGPTYGVSSHVWAALAVAETWRQTVKFSEKPNNIDIPFE